MYSLSSSDWLSPGNPLTGRRAKFVCAGYLPVFHPAVMDKDEGEEEERKEEEEERGEVRTGFGGWGGQVRGQAKSEGRTSQETTSKRKRKGARYI